MGVHRMNKYSGSSFDDFLEEEGILEEVSALAQERLKIYQTKEVSVDTKLKNKLIDMDDILGE